MVWLRDVLCPLAVRWESRRAVVVRAGEFALDARGVLVLHRVVEVLLYRYWHERIVQAARGTYLMAANPWAVEFWRRELFIIHALVCHWAVPPGWLVVVLVCMLLRACRLLLLMEKVLPRGLYCVRRLFHECILRVEARRGKLLLVECL